MTSPLERGPTGHDTTGAEQPRERRRDWWAISFGIIGGVLLGTGLTFALLGYVGVFEEPEPAKFVVSPNAPVQQIWLSARMRSYKLAWSDDAGTFVLDGEQLGTLVGRLAQEQLAQ